MTALAGAGHPTRRLVGCCGWMAVLALGQACANIEAPPGGPPDQAPPILINTVPESLGVFADFDGSVEFIFNETISEGSSPNLGFGSGSLEQLIVLSPSDEVPRVAWKRTRIGVKPREGWRPDRVYRVELLPGVTDIDRNRSETGTVLTFATGGALPTDTLEGRLIDWTQGRPVAGGLILATLLPDSLTYKAVTDSAGGFALGPLRSGEYLVTGVVDQNRNARMDRQESFDSVRVGRGVLEVGALWAFPHDTTGPRIQAIDATDSLTVSISFTQFLDPLQRLDSTAFTVALLPDSVPVSARTILPQAEHDSLYPRFVPVDSAAVQDSLQAQDSLPALDSLPADTVGVDSAGIPIPSPDDRARVGAFDEATQAILDGRPRLFDRLVIRMAEPLLPEGRYFITLTGVRNVNGYTADPAGGFVVPALPELPPAQPDDSLGAGPDSLAVPPDSVAAGQDDGSDENGDDAQP